MTRKIKKLVKILLVGIPLLVLVGLVILFLSLNHIVKGGIERVGSRAVQAPVTVDTVKISPLTGRGSITGLVVGNPRGFKTDSAFRLESIAIDLDLSTLASDTLVINEIIIQAPEITYERALRISNIQQILKNVEEFGGPKDDRVPKRDRPKRDKPDKKIIVRRFELNAARTRVSVTAAGGLALGATLDDIHLDNIGEEEQGASTAEVVSEVLAKLLAMLVDLGDSAGEVLRAGSDAVGGTLKSGQEALDGAATRGAEALQGAGSRVGGGLRGLLGGDEEKNND